MPLLDGVALLHTPVEIRLHRLSARGNVRYGDAIEPGGTLREQHTALMRWGCGVRREHGAGPQPPP